MANSNTTSAKVSTVPPAQELDEIRGFTYNALAVLGPNYLTKKWLPKKGPHFYAFVQALRAHVFWNYETHQQKNKVFFEADTIAKLAGISRSTVFRLLNDPDMALFVIRKPRRRWDKEQHKELQTSNLYYVAMDDPPADDEDRDLVRREQERLATLQSDDAIIEDDDRPARRPRASARKFSECHSDTQIAVSERHSDSSVRVTLEDRTLITLSQSENTSIREGDDVGGETIRNTAGLGRRTKDDDARKRACNPERETKQIGEMSAKRIESDRKEIGYVAPPPPCADVPSAALLSEGEAWKVDARVAAGGIIADNLKQLGGSGEREAVERVLSAHATYRTPAEILAQLADIARNRTRNRAGHIEDDAQAGYFITTLCNMASEAKRAQYDLAKLRKSTEKAARKAQAEDRQAQGLPVTPSQRSRTPRQQAPRGVYAMDRSVGNQGVEEQLRASFYRR
jgi:hypothetical protein